MAPRRNLRASDKVTLQPLALARAIRGALREQQIIQRRLDSSPRPEDAAKAARLRRTRP